MSERSDGGPAFPQYRNNQFGGMNRTADGMSLRDHFAAAAISPMLVQAYGQTPEVLAQKAYEIADAMLAERDK